MADTYKYYQTRNGTIAKEHSNSDTPPCQSSLDNCKHAVYKAHATDMQCTSLNMYTVEQHHLLIQHMTNKEHTTKEGITSHRNSSCTHASTNTTRRKTGNNRMHKTQHIFLSHAHTEWKRQSTTKRYSHLYIHELAGCPFETEHRNDYTPRR